MMIHERPSFLEIDKKRMIYERPFFLNNPEWYYYDESERRYKLTDKAPKEAVESYEYYEKLNGPEEMIEK